MTKKVDWSFLDAPIGPDEYARRHASGVKGGKRKTTPARGHGGVPGTGPEGETCGSCRHCVRRGGTAGRYLKCALNSANWTGGRGSDILSRDPACSRWEKTDA